MLILDAGPLMAQSRRLGWHAPTTALGPRPDLPQMRWVVG
jgi:hypothetical protein